MNIAVIFGGESCEHDISIITGVQLISNMNNYLYNIIPIYINKNGEWYTGEGLKDIDNYPNNLGKLNKCTMCPNDTYLYIYSGRNKFKRYIKIDTAILCLHGMRAEDGVVAGIMECSKIPYTSSSICASSVCMDKVIFKSFAKGLGINVIDGVEICESDFYYNDNIVDMVLDKLGYPVIVKPSRQGSSIGISVCNNYEELVNSLKLAFNYDKSVLIEKYITVKKEVNVAMFDNKGEYVMSNTEEPLTSDKFLNFDNKYRQNPGGFETIRRIVPAGITEVEHNTIVDYSTKVYKGLKMFGVVRFDFLIDEDNVVYLNEVNTIPGSMANYLFDKQKYPYSKLIELWISGAVFRKGKDGEILSTLDTDILNNGFDWFKK